MPGLMPDTRIYGALDDQSSSQRQPPPLQTLGAMMQIKEQQQAMQLRDLQKQKAIREEEDDFAGRQYLQNYEPPEAIDRLFKDGKWEVGSKIMKDYYGAQTERIRAQSGEQQLKAETLGFAGQTLALVHDDPSYQTWLKNFYPGIEKQYGPGARDLLPTQYDEAKVKAVVEASTTRAEQIQREHARAQDWLKLYNDGLTAWSQAAPHVFPEQDAQEQARAKADPSYKPWGFMQEISPNGAVGQQAQRSVIGNQLFNAGSLQEYNQILQESTQHGATPSVVQEFALPNYDPNMSPADQAKALAAAKEKARNMGLTLQQRVELEERRASEERQTRSAADLEASRERTYQRQLQSDAANRALRERELDLRGTQDEWRRAHPTSRDGFTDYQNEVTVPEKIGADIKKVEQWVTENTIVGTQGYEGLRAAAIRGLDPANKNKDPGDVTAAQQAQQYITERVRLENVNRQTQRLPPIDVAARKAIKNGDRAGYQKLVGVYHNTTNGVGELTDIVPWRDNGGGFTAAEKAELLQIETKLKDPKTPEADKARLTARVRQIQQQAK